MGINAWKLKGFVDEALREVFMKLRTLFLALALAVAAAPVFAAAEGSDLEFGGYGSEAGKFDSIRDITFDASNVLYVLDVVKPDANADANAKFGLGRVQKFDATGNPLGGTGGEKIWAAEGPKPGALVTLEMAWNRPQTLGRVMLFGVEADNQFSALLDYDLEAWQNGAWKTIAQVRSDIAPTFWSDTGDARAQSFYVRTNRYAHQFAPVTTERLRLVVHRVTFGFAPDETANDAIFNEWGGRGKARFNLREIQVFEAAQAPKVAQR